MTLDDRIWRRLKRKLASAKGSVVRVGVFQGSGGHPDSDISMPELAAIHEFGAPQANIPERSFIRRTLAEKETELKQIIEKLSGKLMTGRTSFDRALNILGTWAAAEIKKTITESDIPPPLQQATIDAKGSSKPLVDTGRLLNSITHKVV